MWPTSSSSRMLVCATSDLPAPQRKTVKQETPTTKSTLHSQNVVASAHVRPAHEQQSHVGKGDEQAHNELRLLREQHDHLQKSKRLRIEAKMLSAYSRKDELMTHVGHFKPPAAVVECLKRQNVSSKRLKQGKPLHSPRRGIRSVV
jgi:hypothetical protein